MRVHVLDDDAVLGRALVRQLGLLSVAGRAFTTPDELLGAAERPELVMIDFNLGGTTGVLCAPAIERRWPDVPRLLMTASLLTDEELASVHAAGFREILAKPWTLEELRRTLDRLVPGAVPPLAAAAASPRRSITAS